MDVYQSCVWDLVMGVAFLISAKRFKQKNLIRLVVFVIISGVRTLVIMIAMSTVQVKFLNAEVTLLCLAEGTPEMQEKCLQLSKYFTVVYYCWVGVVLCLTWLPYLCCSGGALYRFRLDTDSQHELLLDPERLEMTDSMDVVIAEEREIPEMSREKEHEDEEITLEDIQKLAPTPSSTVEL